MSDPSDDRGDGEFDPVAAVIAREFPGRGVADRRIVPSGNRKRTVVVDFADAEHPRAVVVQTGATRRGVATEATLTRAIAGRTDLPVARVVAVGPLSSLADDRRTRKGGYLVTERRPGSDLHEQFVTLDRPTRQKVAETFGHALARLHEAFRFDGFGRVGVDHEGPIDWRRIVDASDPGSMLVVGGPDGTADGADAGDGGRNGTDDTTAATAGADGPPVTTDWRAWLRSYATAGVERLPPAFDDLRPRLRSELETGIPSLPRSPVSTLYPWDLRPGNALVERGEVTAMLDWGEPLAATPGLGVAKVEHLVCDWYVEDADPLRRAFRAGYSEVRPLPAVPDVYRLAAVVASAVDGEGDVTRPCYPERTGDAAVAFHRQRLGSILA